MSGRYRVFLSVLCAFSLRADAETVDDLVRHVLSDHPDLRALKAGQAAADGESVQASLRPNPELSTEGGLKQVDAEGESESGYVFGLSLEQPIERADKREAREAIASANIGLADLQMQLRMQELAVDVRRLAAEYEVDAADAELADEISRRCHALIDMLKQRPAAGVGIHLELKMVEASLIEFQAAARRFAGQRDSARLALNSLLNRPPDSPLTLAALKEPSLALTNSAIFFERLKDGPRWRMAMLGLERQAGETKAARAAAKSDYRVGPFVSHEDAGEQELSVGLSLSIPLPWRNRNQGAIAAAEARETQALAEQMAVEREMNAALLQALSTYQRANEQLVALPVETVAEIHSAADMAERQYRLGTITVQLFLDMQREYLNVQQLRHDAIRDAWRSALEIQVLAGDYALVSVNTGEEK